MEEYDCDIKSRVYHDGVFYKYFNYISHKTPMYNSPYFSKIKIFILQTGTKHLK